MRNPLTVVIAIVVLVLVIAMTPWVDGMLFKRVYIKNLAIINQENSNLITLTDYKVGWMKSTAILTIAFPKSSGSIVINETISHGPFVRDANSGIHFARAHILSDIHLPKDVESFLLSPNSTTGVMQASTIVSFGNTYRSEFHTPVFNVNQKDIQLSWKGLNGTGEAKFANDYIAFVSNDITVGALTVQSKEGKFSNTDLLSKGSRTCQGLNVLCNFEGESSIANVNFAAVDPTMNVNLNNFKMLYAFGGDDKNHYNINVKLGLAKLTFLKYDISNASLAVVEKNLNKDKLNQMFASMREQTRTMDPNGENKEAMAAILLSTLGIAPQAIDANSLISADLAATTTDGPIKVSTLFEWTLPKPPANMLELSQKMHSKIDVRLATAFVNHMIAIADKGKTPTATTVVAPTAPAPTPVAVVVATPPAPIATTNKSVDDYKKLVVDFVMQKQLNAANGKTLLSFAENRRPINEVIVYLNTLGPAGVKPEVRLALKNAYEKIKDSENAMAIPPLMYAADGRPNYKAQLETLVAQKIITTDVGDKLLVLQEQKLDAIIYNAAIDKMIAGGDLPEGVGKQLKVQYAETINKPYIVSATPVGSSTAAQGSTELTAQALTAQQPQTAQQAFDELIKKGIVVQDKDDYVMSIDYANSMINLNGKTMSIDEFGALVSGK